MYGISTVLSSEPTLGASGVYYAFLHSDGVGQGIVLILLIFSIITWCIMLIKFLGLHQAYKESDQMLREFRSKRNILSYTPPKGSGDDEDCPAAAIFEAGYERMCELAGSEEQLRRNRKPLSDAGIDIVRSVMEETVAEQIVALEKKLIFLMTAVSISPFLGLFGTVWGIMLAFTAMAIQGKPDVSTLAPGVSGALLTTVLGLVVAIPSLTGYNYIGDKIRKITTVMDNFVDEFIAKLRQEQVIAERGENISEPQQTYRQPAQQMTYQQPVQQQTYRSTYQAPQQQYQQPAPQQTRQEPPAYRQTPQPQSPVQQQYQQTAPQMQYQQTPVPQQYQQPAPQQQYQQQTPVQQQAPQQRPAADPAHQPGFNGMDSY